MLKKLTPLLGRLSMLALCAALSAAALTTSASAKDYVKENLERKAGYAVDDFGLPLGGQVDNHKVNVTSVGGSDALFVIQAHTTKSYGSKGDKVFFSLYYEGMDGKLYYTEKLRFDDRVRDFLNCDKALQSGQVNTISVSLSGGARRILGVYFYKNGGKGPLAMDWLTVARVSGSIGGVNSDVTGYRFREFSGECVAYAANLNDLDANTTDTGAIWYTTQMSGGGPTNHSMYALELIAGSDGYVNKNGTVTVEYTDALGYPHSQSIRLREGYGAVQPAKNLNDVDKNGAFKDYNHTITSPWFQTSVGEMQGLAAGYVGNYYTYQDVSETCLRPYTSTGLLLAMPQDIARVDSISLSLDEDDNLILQSVRLVQLSYMGQDYENYWNGGFGLERLRPWSGRLIACSKGSSCTVTGKSSVTFRSNSSTDYLGLTTYARNEGPIVDNTGTGVGVTIQLADVLGAGVETFLAWNGSTHEKPNFAAAEQLEKRANRDARLAWYNLNIFRQECMTLTIRYTDTLDATRQVQIPLMTTYLVSILKQNQGKLTGGSWETWISGVFQQNENVALPIRLAEYKSLVGIQLTYGSAPEGFTSSNSGAVDTADTISIENICFYEGVTSTNFNSIYDTEKLACTLRTQLTPAYSYSASSAQGQQLSSGGTLSASLAAGNLTTGPAKERDYTGRYLIKLKTADIETAWTTAPLSVSLTYTGEDGASHTTGTYSVPTLAANYYGTTYRDSGSDNGVAAASMQYERHMRRSCVCEFVVDLPGAASIDAITLSLDGTDEWQAEYIRIYRLSDLQQRRGERSVGGDWWGHLDWQREYTGEQVASARQSVLLYANNPSKTVYFTTYAENGDPIEPEQAVKENDYLTTLPSSMSYAEATRNLGLSIVKRVYQITVDVADVEDAGSTNYFYFQLLFENGSSAVVLANQQLSSDSFRQGMQESFQIRATQDYGNVTAVRIICDNASSTSNVFDKLNIERITITVSSDTGVSKSWLVENVGWIDITYVDEGSDATVDGLEDMAETTLTNAEIVKDFPVSRTATAVDLLFCIATDGSSANHSSNPLDNALQGSFEATLIYRDSDGVEKTMNFSLTEKIQEYNDTNKTHWLYRPNHVDRFRLSMTDVRSILSLIITRSGGRTDTRWVVNNVSIQQVGGLGEVFLSSSTEYIRTPLNSTDLAFSTNEPGVTYALSGQGSASITFTENTIDVVSQEDSNSWSTTISRVPTANNESLNIYLFPGSTTTASYTFTPNSPAVRATVKYTTVYGGSLVQNSFNLGALGTIDGQTVLFGKNLPVSAMSALNSLVLSSTATSGEQPYIGAAIVERVRSGVIMGTYYFHFGGFYLGNGNPECSPSSSGATAMEQVLRLQPAAGQSAPLTADSGDIAVALRYTSRLDPSENKTVYQSPYVYLTDAGYSSVVTGQLLDIPFSLSNVGEVVGLSIVSTGPIVSFDNAIAYNYSAPPAGGGTRTLLGTASLAQSFTASSIATVLTDGGDVVTPALFRFTTSPEEASIGAATAGRVSMTVDYTDFGGNPRSMYFDDVLSFLSGGPSAPAGSTVEAALQLDNAACLNSVTIAAEDSWLLAAVSAQLTLPNGQTSASSTTVNNWATADKPLTIDLLNAANGGMPTGNQIQTFTVTGRGRSTGVTSSASSGGSLLVTAYPNDVVDLIPVITAVGAPDTSWTWNIAPALANSLMIHPSDNTASFYVPYNLSPGDTCTFSVACNGDNRLAVAVTIAVESRPEEPPAQPPPDTSGEAAGEEAGDGAAEPDAGGSDSGGPGENGTESAE